MKLAQIKLDSANFVEFIGEDELEGREGHHYSQVLTLKQALEKRSDILIAWEMNGEPLKPDHGYPLRLIVPGMIGAKSVKWLNKITVHEHEPQSFIFKRDFKVFPAKVDTLNVSKHWEDVPGLSYLNIDCVITNLISGDKVPKERHFVIKGYAISGRGLAITRVEISFDQGLSWSQCKIRNFKDKRAIKQDSGCQAWEWTTWDYSMSNGLENPAWVMVRAFDEMTNTQPEEIGSIWNFKGYMNNTIHRIKLIPME